MTKLENALIKTLQTAQQLIETGRVQSAHEIIVTALNHVNHIQLNPTTGETQCPTL